MVLLFLTYVLWIFNGNVVCAWPKGRRRVVIHFGEKLQTSAIVWTIREWDCAIVKLKAVDGQSGTVVSSSWRLLTVRVGLCYRQAEGCWQSEWDCAIVKLKVVDGQSGIVLSYSWRLLTVRVGLCYRQAEGCWRSESGTVLSSSWRLLTAREWDCAIVKLKAVDGQRVGLCYRQAEGCWRSEWDCAIVKLKAVDGQRVGLCYRQAEGCWRSESVLSYSLKELTAA